MLTPTAYQPSSLLGVYALLAQDTVFHLEVGFALICFQRLSLPNLATQRCPWQGQMVHQRFVLSGPLVLGETLLKDQRLRQIGDKPVSRMLFPCYQGHGLYHLPKTWKVDILSQFL